MDEETELSGGGMGGVSRVGCTVRRPSGPWTPAVHGLLGYLNEAGLRGVPKVHGVDEEGREVLEYVEGRSVPVDREVVLDTVLVEAVAWLREYHDLVYSYRPDGPVLWRTGEAQLEPGQIICHNDPGAYNWIIQSGHFVAMIDWDLAAPGDPLDDLAFLAWTALPLYRETPLDDVARRLGLLVDTYAEYGPLTVLNAVTERMTKAADRIEAGVARGDEGLMRLARTRGEPQRTRGRVAAYADRIAAIDAALT